MRQVDRIDQVTFKVLAVEFQQLPDRPKGNLEVIVLQAHMPLIEIV